MMNKTYDFCYKVHKIKDQVLLAVCDKSLVGKKLGDLDFPVSENFYSEKDANQEDLDILFEECSIGNLVGKKIIEFSIKKKFITKENVIMIGDIPHAQFIK